MAASSDMVRARIYGSEGELAGDTVLHHCILANDVPGLRAALGTAVGQANINARDPQGNPPILLATVLNRIECVELLLAAGADTSVKNAGKWSAVAEAISVGNKPLVYMLLQHYKDQTHAMATAKTTELLSAVADMPDFYLELHWDIRSWVPLLSRVLPSDLLRIWKAGPHIRMDTTLLDISEQTICRGDRSYVFELLSGPPRVTGTMIDRVKHTFARQQLWPPSDDGVADEEEDEDVAQQHEKDVNTLMGTDLVDVIMNSETVLFAAATSGFFVRAERIEPVGPFLDVSF